MKTKKNLGSRDFYQHNLLNMEGSPLDLEDDDDFGEPIKSPIT